MPPRTIVWRNPYVHGDFKIRFYAAALIITPDQQVIGTMCLVDHQPRGLSKHEQDILQDLAKVVMEQAELRLANIDSIESQQSINGKLEHNEQHLKGILDTMAERVTIVNSQGQPTYANGMAQKILDATLRQSYHFKRIRSRFNLISESRNTPN